MLTDESPYDLVCVEVEDMLQLGARIVFVIDDAGRHPLVNDDGARAADRYLYLRFIRPALDFATFEGKFDTRIVLLGQLFADTSALAKA